MFTVFHWFPRCFLHLWVIKVLLSSKKYLLLYGEFSIMSPLQGLSFRVCEYWRNSHRTFSGLVFLIILTSAASVAHAQYDSATVLGSVTDPRGAVVAGAAVALRNTDMGTVLTRKTNSDGVYEFPDIQVGTYTVTVNATGFSESVTKPFQLTVAARQRIDVSLTIGTASESVTVSVNNAGLQTESGEQSTTIQTDQIIDLPLNGREYTDLALLVPGAQVGAMQDSTVTQRRGSIVINGNRSSVNNFLLDGLDNNSYQIANQGFNNQAVAESVDAVQEYTVTTSNFLAEYGRAGGAIVNVKTKSGSDKFHASLYEYLRNTVFDAYGPFYGNGTKPALIQNQFGGSVGYHIPHIRNFFFFIDYEGFRQATRTIQSLTIPTRDERNGILVAPASATDNTLVSVPVQNPLTGKQYPNGIIPARDYTPFAAAVLGVLPDPTSTIYPGFQTNFVVTGPGHNYRDIGDIRLDKYFGNRLQVFARLSKQSVHLTAPPGITGPAGGSGFGHIRVLTTSGVAGATIVLTPSSVLDLRLGIVYAESGKVPYNQGVPNFYSRFGIPYPVLSSIPPSGLNTQAVRDFSTLGIEATQNQFSNPQTYNIKGSYTLARGKHSFSFGYEWLQLNETVDPGFPLLGEDSYVGSFSYLGCHTSTCNTPSSTVGRRQAIGLADFIFGLRDNYQLGNYTAPTEYYDFQAAYMEDSWRALPRLTLTYGLRYEFTTPERSRDQPIVNFDPHTNALEIATSGSMYNEALVDPKLNDFAPRFGFAYSMYPNVVFRGGYGLSYIQWNRYGGESELLNNGPYTVNGSVDQLPSQPLCSDGSQSLTCFRTTMQGYPTSMISAASFSTGNTETRYVPRDSAPGYVQSYSIGTQIQMNKGTEFRLSYVGSHDVHVRVLGDYNEAAQQLPGQTLTLAQRRPIQNFEDIYDSASVGFLRYNSLQAQLTHRERGGLYLMNSFTWAKAIDNASADLEAGHGDSAYVHLQNLKYNAGISGYNQTLNDSLSVVWRIPFGARLHNKTLCQSIAGWRLTTITRMTSGIPMNITFSPSNTYITSNLGIPYRPNYTGALYTIVNPRSKWTTAGCNGYCNVLSSSHIYDPTDSTLNAVPSPYGNMPRNALTGPGYVNMDMGLQKVFKLPDHINLQFRAEAFNLFNHTNFKTPNIVFLSTGFGTFAPGSSSVFPSRQMQFGLRLTY